MLETIMMMFKLNMT